MVMIAALFGLMAAIAMGFAWRDQHSTITRLWQHIDILEGDKRALTESLCRAQGKPYISPTPQERIPSDGWFDGRPEVRVKEADERNKYS